jgi:Secretion system C-terminal sorting domain
MHTRLTILLCLFICQVKGQVNLVPNYSFEEVDSCNFDFNDFDVLTHWFKPTQGSSDVCNACTPEFGSSWMPENTVGFQYAEDGLGYSGVFFISSGIFNYREYLGVKLITPLQANITYCVKFSISLAEDFPLSISSIGAYFSRDSIFQNDYKRLPYTPQIENPDSNFINDTTVWIAIKSSFKAEGNEQYMYIGNFRPDNATIMQNFTPGASSYVYIDNVQVYECDSTLSINENLKGKVTIYPNPAQDFVSIDIPTNYPNPQLRIYNLTGQLVAQKQITANQQIPISALGNGMYIFVIQSGDKIIGRQRVVVAR